MSPFEHLLEAALGSPAEPNHRAPFEDSLRAFEDALMHVPSPTSDLARAARKGIVANYRGGADDKACLPGRSFYA
jgi:hypothetical protein